MRSNDFPAALRLAKLAGSDRPAQRCVSRQARLRAPAILLCSGLRLPAPARACASEAR
ncbi:MAG: hypothetical protein KJ025_17330 [Burkholderiales bacterium]|nr:hypothetical protein [Burkholderiales bacterium]